MRKILILTLILMVWLAMSLPALASTLSPEKQAVVNKLKSEAVQSESKLAETSFGIAQYKINQLDGGLPMMVPQLANLKGTNLTLDYKLNAPAKQMGLDWSLNYQGNHRGQAFISGNKLILTSSIVQLANQLNPGFASNIPANLPQYLYSENPEFKGMWSAILASGGRSVPPQAVDILAFALEAIPDKHFSNKDGKIQVSISQKDLPQAILAVTEKIKAEPERFTTLVARYLSTNMPTSGTEGSFEKLRDDMLQDLRKSIAKGEFPPSLEEINKFFAQSGLELESFTIVTPSSLDGATKLNLVVNIKDVSGSKGNITLDLEQKRIGDTVNGSYTVNIMVSDKAKSMDVSVKANGDYMQSKTTAVSNMKLVVNAMNGMMPMLNLELETLGKAQVDENVKVNVPVLTHQNSLNMDQLKEQEVRDIPGFQRKINVMLDGRMIHFDVPPYIKDNRTIVPIRNLAEALNCDVTFVNGREIHIKKEGNHIIMKLGEKRYTVNGKVKNLDVPAFAKDGRTMVPLRFIAEEFGCQVSLQDNTVVITTRKTSKKVT